MRRGLLCIVGFAALLSRAVTPEVRADGPPPPLAWVLPEGARVVGRAIDAREERLDLYIESWSGRPSEAQLEDVVRAALEDEIDQGHAVRGVMPWVARDGGWVPLVSLVPRALPVPRKAWEPELTKDKNLDERASERPGPVIRTASALAPATGGRRAGALSGKHVYVSAGHGFTWDPDGLKWETQRGNSWDIVEDLVSAETVNQLLVTGLENAGATVWTVRERDMNAVTRVVDDADATTTGTWSASTAAGFASGRAPYVGNVNPFTTGGTQVSAAVAVAPTATMTWRADVPVAGDYGVYVSWSASDNRVSDAHYVVRHAGGEHHVRIDQTRHGGTWFHLGRFHFAPGDGGAVVLMNDTGGSSDSRFVAADAVRFGGGMGDFARGNGTTIPRAPTSGRPRWEENARYHIQYAGAPSSVYAYTSNERSDDVGSRSRYSAWQHEDGEDAIYVAWHTNAPDPGRGTSTYVYGPNPPDGSYDFTGADGSDDLARSIHDTLVAAIRARFDASWRSRGVYSAYFGEINPNHNDEMPSTLVEVAFHSTEADAAWLKEPSFRAVAARAYVHGIVKYFSDRDGVPALLPPEPPTAVRVVGTGAARVRVSWQPPAEDPAGGDAPSGYRVYRSPDGRAFDDGTSVSGLETTLDVAEGEVVYVRVTSENAGGESFPSPVLAALPSCDGEADALVVMAFYRLDARVLPRDDLSAYGLGTVVRGRLAEANRFDYVVEHAQALAAAGVAFDSAEATAAVELADYRFVDWLLGEQSVADGTVSPAEQARIAGWLSEAGRTLLMSGSETVWDLATQGDANDVAFLTSLGVALASDDAETYVLSDGLLLDDGTRGTYPVEFPDVLAPLGGAEVVLTYGDGQVAGTRATLPSGARAIVLGVPLEALSPADARAALVARLVPEGLAGLDCEAPVEPVEPNEPGPEPSVESDVEPTLTPDGGATAGRPSREVRLQSHRGDGGCEGGTSSLLVAFVTVFMASLRFASFGVLMASLRFASFGVLMASLRFASFGIIMSFMRIVRRSRR